MKNDPYYEFINKTKNQSPKLYGSIFNKVRKRVISKQLGIDPNKILTLDMKNAINIMVIIHSNNLKKSLILTLEGGGDDSSATISVSDGKKSQKNIKLITQ